MQHRKIVTIYGASSPDIEKCYKEAAFETGRLLAEAGVAVACGGGRSGLMAAVIDGASESGGHTIGVLPEFMEHRGWGHAGLSEKIITPDIHTRKKRMLSIATGVIALPGGVGTLEELLEAITWRQLNLYRGQIVILNTAGYYAPLAAMLERSVEQHFMHPDHRELWQIASTPAEAVRMVLSEDNHGDFSQKIRVD